MGQIYKKRWFLAIFCGFLLIFLNPKGRTTSENFSNFFFQHFFRSKYRSYDQHTGIEKFHFLMNFPVLYFSWCFPTKKWLFLLINVPNFKIKNSKNRLFLVFFNVQVMQWTPRWCSGHFFSIFGKFIKKWNFYVFTFFYLDAYLLLYDRLKKIGNNLVFLLSRAVCVYFCEVHSWFVWLPLYQKKNQYLLMQTYINVIFF